MTTYTPKPIDVAAVELPPALTALLERLAENTHEVWAEGRLAEGWTFGPTRDDAAKRHPGLVPYGELTESEKEYDRRTAAAALKAIVALGWTIVERP
ncbi:MAG: RyR domain-containing protein [Planctomycetia bacterium]